MKEDKSPESEYVLIDRELRPSYAKIGEAVLLSQYEVWQKNYAFTLNGSSKIFIKEKDWK